MRHEFKCTKCGEIWTGHCFEYMNYTAKGWETRKRQMDSDLCPKCFGEPFEMRGPNDPPPPTTYIGMNGEVVGGRDEKGKEYTVVKGQMKYE